jgi:hypothetical protein
VWLLTIRFLTGVVHKLAPLVMVILLVVAGAGLFLFVRDRLEWEVSRGRQLEALNLEETRLLALQEEVRGRWEVLQEQHRQAQERYQLAERMIARLAAFQGFWDNLFRSKEDRERDRERLLWAEQKKKEISWSLEDLDAQLKAASVQLQRLEGHLQSVQQDRQLLEKAESEVLSYAQAAWVLTKQPLLLGLGAYLLGPSLWKVFCYFLWAPLILLGRPILLRQEAGRELLAAASQVSKRVPLRPGERAVLKEKFLQASDEALRRRTRFVFDWRIPFSSAACGLIELTEMVNQASVQTYSVTFSTQEDPTTELSEIELPAGGSLVLRPSHLAGVVTNFNERLRIERHWRFFSIHAWVTLQFRYFEFHGPCRLIVCGTRGVRAESMQPPAGEASLARRTNQDSTIGFTPNLEYYSARAETFWAYYRGRNPLFDDVFRGAAGAFVCQEITSRERAGSVRRFWSNFWGGLLKVFGL